MTRLELMLSGLEYKVLSSIAKKKEMPLDIYIEDLLGSYVAKIIQSNGQLKKEPQKLKHKDVLDFGEHKGLTVGFVRIEHPKYYDWLLKEEIITVIEEESN